MLLRLCEYRNSFCRFSVRGLSVKIAIGWCWLVITIGVSCFVPSSGAGTLFGFESVGGTWYDAEKTLSNPDDDLMCWAAAASNVLLATGWARVTGDLFADEDDVFTYFQDHWTDNGGSSYYGWEWWFDGTYDGPTEAGWSQVDVPGGGFWPGENYGDYVLYSLQDAPAMNNINYLFSNSYGVTLGISGPGAHAITAWGMEYDDATGDYLGLYVTDSDDSKTSDSPPDLLQYYDVVYSEANTAWYLQNYYGTNDWYINEVFGLAYRMAPEPSALTLFLLGALVLMSGRSRHVRD